MKLRQVSERGQALVLVALAIIGLVGITGLAIDGSIILADRRHAQNAADTAALAGAIAKLQAQIPAPDGPGLNEIDARAPMKTAALNRAISNGYYADLQTSQVEVYSCAEDDASCPDPYADDEDYVQVIITSHVDTFFARVLGVETLTNRVQAVALADYDDTGPLFGGAAIYALNPDCPSQGSLIINGGNNTKLSITGGGMASNSDDSCAVKCGLGTSSSLNIPGGITTAGGDYTWVGQCTDTSFPHSTDNTQLDYHDDVPDLPEPPECDPTDPDNYSGHEKKWVEDPVTHAMVYASFVGPGYYDSFPPKKVDYVTTENTIFLAPGVYCVDSVLKQNSDVISTYGDDVTIYVRPGNDIKINGGVMQLRAINGDGAPYAPHGNSNKDYRGYLFIAAPDYDGPVTSCVIDGNSTNIYVGAIFAPHCNVTINGNGDTPPDGIITQIVGYNVTINGSADITIQYDSDLLPIVPDPSQTGITQ
jgi:hypothetical protein